MKIGSPDSQSGISQLVNDRKAAGTEKKSGSAAAEPVSAEVAISSTASELRNAPTDATFDTEKVQRMAQAIRDGKFEVNASKIADKLISNAQELLGRQPS